MRIHVEHASNDNNYLERRGGKRAAQGVFKRDSSISKASLAGTARIPDNRSLGHCHLGRHQHTVSLTPAAHQMTISRPPRTPPDSGSCQAVSHIIVPMKPTFRLCVSCRGLWQRLLLKSPRGEAEECVVPSRHRPYAQHTNKHIILDGNARGVR